MQTGHGTSNLARDIEECNSRYGVDNETVIGAWHIQQTIEKSISEYMPVKHHALIALCCAVLKQPFNMVNNPLYVQEVALLHPGTVLPSPSTISHDVNYLYFDGSGHVKDYFSVHLFLLVISMLMCKTRNTKHLFILWLMAGWTSPFTYSYLGIIVVWFSSGRIWYATLEFIWLVVATIFEIIYPCC